MLIVIYVVKLDAVNLRVVMLSVVKPSHYQNTLYLMTISFVQTVIFIVYISVEEKSFQTLVLRPFITIIDVTFPNGSKLSILPLFSTVHK
jgi:hypothetical protein